MPPDQATDAVDDLLADAPGEDEAWRSWLERLLSDGEAAEGGPDR